MLDRSHRKLEEKIGELRAAAESIARGAPDDDALEVVSDVLSFFDRSVARHEADEEESLFPRLRGRGIDPVIDTLSDEHREHTRLLYRLRELQQSWQGRAPDAERGQHLVRLVNELDADYTRHLGLEDERLFPAAKQLLGPAELESIALEMQARRGRDAG